jgi:hypothetical protein
MRLNPSTPTIARPFCDRDDSTVNRSSPAADRVQHVAPVANRSSTKSVSG